MLQIFTIRPIRAYRINGTIPEMPLQTHLYFSIMMLSK